MWGRKFFLIFLLVSLALTSFLAGYILVDRGVKTNASQNTGTLLDRFEGRVLDIPDNQGPPLPNLPKVTTQKFLNLNPNINTYAISPDNQKIAYFIPPKKEGGEGHVFISNLDNSNSKSIFKTRVVDLSISWVNETRLSIEIDPLKESIILNIKTLD